MSQNEPHWFGRCPEAVFELTLYHLGVVFVSCATRASSRGVSHITSRIRRQRLWPPNLVLNWQRYNGIGAGLRTTRPRSCWTSSGWTYANRIVRRFSARLCPQTVFAGWLERAVRGSFTRPRVARDALRRIALRGQVPVRVCLPSPNCTSWPTNLNEGMPLLVYASVEILFQRRMPDGTTRFELTGRVRWRRSPWAVTASVRVSRFFSSAATDRRGRGRGRKVVFRHICSPTAASTIILGVRMFRPYSRNPGSDTTARYRAKTSSISRVPWPPCRRPGRPARAHHSPIWLISYCVVPAPRASPMIFP